MTSYKINHGKENSLLTVDNLVLSPVLLTNSDKYTVRLNKQFHPSGEFHILLCCNSFWSDDGASLQFMSNGSFLLPSRLPQMKKKLDTNV